MKSLAYLSGLPRSGSTMLASLLNQHPEIYASATSPMSEVIRGIRDGWGTLQESRAMPEAEYYQKLRGVLRGALLGCYAETDKRLVLDKSRSWPYMLETLRELGPVKMLVCVRDLSEVVASWEMLWRKSNALGAFDNKLDTLTLEGRLQAYMRPDHPIGHSYNAVVELRRRAVRREYLFVYYDRLLSDPHGVLNEIYTYLEVECFQNDTLNIFQPNEDDRAYNLMNAHKVASAVHPNPPYATTVLGATVAHDLSSKSFWNT